MATPLRREPLDPHRRIYRERVRRRRRTPGGLQIQPDRLGLSECRGATLQPKGENLDAYRFGTADLGAQFNLLPSRALNPYLRAALTGQVAAFDIPGTSDNLEARGGGITLGGGLLYAVSPKLSLDLSLDATGGRFTELVFDGDTTSNFDEIDSGIGRLGFGLVFQP